MTAPSLRRRPQRMLEYSPDLSDPPSMAQNATSSPHPEKKLMYWLMARRTPAAYPVTKSTSRIIGRHLALGDDGGKRRFRVQHSHLMRLRASDCFATMLKG